jgi:predicted nucleic acid-binding protein
MAVLLDTGAIYALADRDDAWHERVKSLLDQHPDPFLVPITVLPEACYLLNAHLGQEAERAFLRACASGELTVVPMTTDDLARSVEILALYADANLGFVDASVFALAERLNISAKSPPRIVVTFLLCVLATVPHSSCSPKRPSALSPTLSSPCSMPLASSPLPRGERAGCGGAGMAQIFVNNAR